MAGGAKIDLLALIHLVLADLRQGKLPSIDLIKMLVSKALGYAVLTGATIVKVPQILNVVRAGSAEGINAVSIELEVLGYFIHFSYGFLLALPFSTYGEALLLLTQTVVLLLLVNSYARAPLWRSAAVVAMLAIVGGAVGSGKVSTAQIQTAYQVNNLVFVASRVPQIITNFQAKSTGQLSIITAFLNFGGSVARIFTSLQEQVGSAMVQGYVIGALLNCTLFVQILVYGKGKKPARGRRTTARKKTH